MVAKWLSAAVAGAVLVAAATGCRSRADRSPLLPVTHLVAVRYQRGEDPAMAGVPIAAVGGVFRPVLSTSSARTLVRRVLEQSERSRLAVDVPFPEELRGIPAYVTAAVAAVEMAVPAPRQLSDEGGRALEFLYGPGTPVSDQEPRFFSAPGPHETLEITLADGVPTTPLLLVTARPEPERSYTTPPLTIPAAAHLRFGIGAQRLGTALDSPVDFVVTAVRSSEEELFRTRVDPQAGAWADQDVDLSRYAGDVLRLRFEADVRAGDASARPALPLWGDPGIFAPAARPRPRRRNVLLISLDTLRADHLGCYGSPRPTSPTVDRELAGRGTLFERAYTSYPSTAGAHMTLLTSLDPCVHGVVGKITEPPLRPDAPTLAELLRAAGYETAAFTEDALITAGKGFARGFGTYIEDRVGLTDGAAERTFDRALGWIRRHQEAPWFVFVHTYQVHSPYTPPPGYVEKVAPEEHGDTASPVVRYDGEIRYTDDLLARLLRNLDDLGPADGTLVLLVSDHGEHFGEHGLTGHGNSLFRALLHVPLIIRAPGLVPAGRRVGDTVGLVDVVPTVLDLLGLPAPAGLQGHSLLPLLQRGPHAPRRIFAQLGEPSSAIAVHDTVKWIVGTRPPVATLFGLDDPVEEDARRDAGPAGVLLRDFHAHCEAAPARPVPVGGVELDPAVREKLKALGYLN